MCDGSGWRLPIARDHRTSATAGPLVFVGGAGDFDRQGRIRNPEDFEAQLRGALDNVAAALADRDCGLADVVRLKGYYSSDGSRNEWAVLAALACAFEDAPAPTISLLPVPLQPFAGQTIQLQAIACPGWRTGPNIRAVEAAVPADAASLFDRPAVTRALRAGEVISVALQAALDGEGLATTPGDGLAQTDVVMARIDEALAALGASFQDVIKKEGYYVGTTMDQWAPMAERRARHFREPGPVATVVPAHVLCPEGVVTKVEVLAMRAEWNGFDKYIAREDRWPARVWDWPIPVPYRQGLRLRDMIWTGGQVPFEEGLNTGKAVHAGDLAAQTRFTMGYVNDIVEAFAHPSRDYAMLVCYFASGGTPAETEAFIDTIAETVDGALPPLTVVPQPHMHSAEIGVEIWGVAASD
jgi:enamine deaminase RidA (YjgF/YER057c/UK114 family)